MRNVQVWFRFSVLATVILALVVAVAGTALSQGSEDSTLSTVVGVGLALFAVALIFSVVFWQGSRAARRARRPDQRIAAWRIDPAAWEAFRQRDAARAREIVSYLPVFTPRKAVPASGVEVIAARNGFLIDDVFLALEPRGLGAMTGLQWLSGRPECLEFAILVPSPGASGTLRTVPGAFRVPVDPAAREAAAVAFAYFQSRGQAGDLSDPRGHRLVVRLAALIGVLGVVAGGIALLMAQAGQTGTPVLMVALVGLIGGGGALFVALVVWAVMLRK